jgi:hypothetical protein
MKTRQTMGEKCCECGEHEDAKHVYRCDNARRVSNRKKFWIQTTKRLKRWMDGRTLYHMWLGLHPFEKEHEPEAGSVRHPYEITLENAFRDQTKIGWYQMLMSRMSSTWAEAKRNIWTAEGRIMKLNDTTWTARIVSSLWDDSLMMWLDRNEGVHGSSKTRSELETEAVMANVDKAYEFVEQELVPSDR